MRSKYFKIQEFVSPEVYNKYGEKAWQFIDDRLIEAMDYIREEIGKPITINNWLWGGNLKQRGLRANKDEMVSSKKDYYISQHCLGKAVDFNVKDMTTKEVYDWILQHKHDYKLLCIKRMEDINSTPTWVHIDLANTESKELYVFKP